MLDGATLSSSAFSNANDREFKYTQADFHAIAAALREEAGISLPDDKAHLVYARLVKRLRKLNLTSFTEYVALLTGADAADERRSMLTALTTNVTRFFREGHHFEHLRTRVLAPLTHSSKIDRLRLWSAACSTGQEPYSIAAVVADTIPDAERMGIKILATDIDPIVVQHAERGSFDAIDGVPANMRRWFERDGSVWSVDPRLRNLITFKCLNLNAQWPVRGPFDVVFCRNVAIYFDPNVQARLWESFARVMPPGATFYIGHSERVTGPATAAFVNIGITTYQRRDVNP